MKVLILNPILFTADNNVIPQVKSIKDTMIYNMCLGFKRLGHDVTLAAAEEYAPAGKEAYDFEILFSNPSAKNFSRRLCCPFSPELWPYIKKKMKNHSICLYPVKHFQFSLYSRQRICPEKTVIWQELTDHQNKFHRLPSKIWHNVIVRLFMQRIAAVAPRSGPAYKFISKYMPQTVKQIVDHGINVDKFTYSEKKNAK